MNFSSIQHSHLHDQPLTMLCTAAYFVSWALLLHVCNILMCIVSIATLCHEQCFIYCMLLTTMCCEHCHVVPYGHCCFIYCIPCSCMFCANSTVLYCTNQNIFAYVQLVYFSLSQLTIFRFWELEWNLKHGQYMFCAKASYYCMLCIAMCCPVLWALLLCAKGIATFYIVCCVMPHILCHGHCCFLLLCAMYVHVYCLMPYTLLLHILYAVYSWVLLLLLIVFCVLPCVVSTATVNCRYVENFQIYVCK